MSIYRSILVCVCFHCLFTSVQSLAKCVLYIMTENDKIIMSTLALTSA